MASPAITSNWGVRILTGGILAAVFAKPADIVSVSAPSFASVTTIVASPVTLTIDPEAVSICICCFGPTVTMSASSSAVPGTSLYQVAPRSTLGVPSARVTRAGCAPRALRRRQTKGMRRGPSPRRS